MLLKSNQTLLLESLLFVVLKDLKDLKAQLESKDPKVTPDHKDPLVLLGRAVLKVKRATKATRVTQDFKDLKVCKVRRDPLDQKVTKEIAAIVV